MNKIQKTRGMHAHLMRHVDVNALTNDQHKELNERCMKSIQYCLRIRFKDLPLNINHEQIKVRSLVKWRLEQGV